MQAVTLTPMMRQYYTIKQTYPDVILLFRVGDFYETFDEDAKITSKELQITLTSRKEGHKRIPMAGVPHHASNTYIEKLIKKGYKVAICEQAGYDKARKIENRRVVRVITPGTVVEGSMLDEGSNNYLASIHEDKGKVGLALVDISTGDFSVTEFEDDEKHKRLRDEISRFRPAEILVPSTSSLHQIISEDSLTCCDDSYFDYTEAYVTLINHFGVISLDGFGCSSLRTAISAAGAIISYLRDIHQKIDHISSLHTFHSSDYMTIDYTTQRNLEIFRNIRDGSTRGTLVSILDKTKTAMGSRLLKKQLRTPLLNTEEISKRLDPIEVLKKDILLREELIEILDGIYDIERIISRITYGNANPRDLISLKRSLENVHNLRGTLADTNISGEIKSNLGDFSDVIGLIENSIVEDPPSTIKEGGVIKRGFNSELDEIRRIKTEGSKYITEMESKERSKTGIKSLKIGYNKAFGFYIEVTKPNIKRVPSYYIRKQTLTNSERFITDELRQFEAKVLSAEERLKGMEYDIFDDIRRRVTRESERIKETANAIAELDVLTSLATVAADNEYTRPIIDEGDEITIKDGRHPVLEQMLEPGHFVSNDTYLSKENRIMVLTGPNMSGKSTYMRQVALIVLMAQIGSFVPASYAKIGLVDRVFTRVGAYDDLTMGQSSFMVEMGEVANILNNATPYSLILLDEIGRGTSTLDGLGIAWAVAEYIHGKGARTMLATHFYKLTEIAEHLDGVKNYNVSVKEDEDDIYFVYKVKEGEASKSYGLQVAKLAGLPSDVIDNAKKTLEGLENDETDSSKVIIKREYVDHPVIDRLRNLDIDNMTPMDGMNKLYEIQKELKNE